MFPQCKYMGAICHHGNQGSNTIEMYTTLKGWTDDDDRRRTIIAILIPHMSFAQVSYKGESMG